MDNALTSIYLPASEKEGAFFDVPYCGPFASLEHKFLNLRDNGTIQ